MNSTQSGTLHLGNMANENAVPTKKDGIVYVIAGWVFFAISLLFIPILFGAGALIMGYLTFLKRSEFQGIILMFFAAVGIILGSLYSFLVAGTMFI
ncbi:hypothetical protein V7124_20740 [Neobacillus niacini]|uniref:hypothetical protein n=1 Tax=Neobacillus niacini TaxID=86668 RepID=UPI002FFEF333